MTIYNMSWYFHHRNVIKRRFLYISQIPLRLFVHPRCGHTVLCCDSYYRLCVFKWCHFHVWIILLVLHNSLFKVNLQNYLNMIYCVLWNCFAFYQLSISQYMVVLNLNGIHVAIFPWSNAQFRWPLVQVRASDLSHYVVSSPPAEAVFSCSVSAFFDSWGTLTRCEGECRWMRKSSRGWNSGDEGNSSWMHYLRFGACVYVCGYCQLNVWDDFLSP